MVAVHQYCHTSCSKMCSESQYCYIHSINLLLKFALRDSIATWWPISTPYWKVCIVSQYCYIHRKSFWNWPSLTMGCGTSPEHKIPYHRSGYPAAWGPHTGHLSHSSHPHCGRPPSDVSLLYHTHWSTANQNDISFLLKCKILKCWCSYWCNLSIWCYKDWQNMVTSHDPWNKIPILKFLGVNSL